ncbi:hypothetical protein [Ktedonospora formicarum]|nr:hypothetical protein [Ktedonospora formicarum]
MRAHYTAMPQAELMKALPHRAWYRICDRAQVLGLRRAVPFRGRAPINTYHRTMRYDDLEAIMGLVQTDEEKERVCHLVNTLAQETMRGNLSIRWLLPLDLISYASVDNDASSVSSNALLLNLSDLTYGSRHQA